MQVLIEQSVQDASNAVVEAAGSVSDTAENVNEALTSITDFPMGWQQETLRRLDAISDELVGVADYLWPELVKEQLAFGITGLVSSLLLLCLPLIAFKVYKKLLPKIMDQPYESFPLVIGWISVVVVSALSILCVVFAFNDLQDAIPLIVAPEAAAFRSLIPQ